MANPQAEDGHVDLANEIVEALAKIRISGEEMQCLWVIFRKTYGWHKKEDSISLSQFCEFTGIHRRNVCRALSRLIQKGIVAKTPLGRGYKDTRTTTYRFNKDFDTWAPRGYKDTSVKNAPRVGAIKRTKLGAFWPHTKEKNTTIQKKVLSDDEFLLFLKEKFTWVDFEQEMAKIDAWLLANPGRQKTRRFVVKWISKVQKPMQIKKPKIEGDYPRAEDVLKRQGFTEKDFTWKNK